MTQTGDYWLLAVTNNWEDQPNYIIINYADNSCSYWSNSLNINIPFEVLDKPLPTMPELVEHDQFVLLANMLNAQNIIFDWYDRHGSEQHVT